MWQYEIAIPHKTFDVLKDGEKYCRGIVFSMDDLAGERSEKSFEQALIELINRFSLEGDSNTPDFILAEYLTGCLKQYNEAIQKRGQCESN